MLFLVFFIVVALLVALKGNKKIYFVFHGVLSSIA